jgi:large subunit ribosomal protein L32
LVPLWQKPQSPDALKLIFSLRYGKILDITSTGIQRRITTMAVPKRKTSKSKRNMRRSHHALTATNWSEDAKSGEPVRRHHIDLKSGTYKGRQVLEARD